MTTDAVALVVHPDASFLALATDALMLFEPGFRVATAPDLGEASEWLETLTPAVVVVGTACGAPQELRRWLEANEIDPAITILVQGRERGEEGGFDRLGVAATVAEPIELRELLEEARRVNAAGVGTDRERASNRQ